MIPICQDTGMAVVFIKVGQEVHFEGGSLTDAINQGFMMVMWTAFKKVRSKRSILRENTKDNTPAIIHYEITEGDPGRYYSGAKGL